MTPTRVRDDANPPTDSDSFSLTRLFKYLKDGVKFTGQGKVPTQDLFNLQIAIEVALHSVEAPQDYFDILNLESQVEEFSSKVNRNTYLILHQVTESKAHELVNRFCKTFDGRQAWKALQNEFLPIDALSLANLLTLVHSYTIKPGPPETQLDFLQRTIDTANKCCQLQASCQPYPPEMYRVLFIAALSRGGPTYTELVISLNRSTFNGEGPVSIQEIRSLAASSYNTQKAREKAYKSSTAAINQHQGGRGGRGGRGNQGGRGRGGRSGGASKGGGDGEKSKNTKDPKTPPICKICQAQGVESKHWHSECPNKTTTVTTTTPTTASTSKTVTFEDLDDSTNY